MARVLGLDFHMARVILVTAHRMFVGDIDPAGLAPINLHECAG